jgi:hypothetical protein
MTRGYPFRWFSDATNTVFSGPARPIIHPYRQPRPRVIERRRHASGLLGSRPSQWRPVTLLPASQPCDLLHPVLSGTIIVTGAGES